MTAAVKENAAGLSITCRIRSSVETPNDTTHASKLIQMRRKASAWIRRMASAPSGTPASTLGMIQGSRPTLSRTNKPAATYAIAVSVDSTSRTRPSAARNSSFEKPWLLSATASGGPEIVVTA
jgi:hypothetical protein